ncbi:MAG: hemolysin family protein [Terriglobia bacterium]
MVQILTYAAVLVVLIFLLALFSYLQRLYQERGHEGSRRVRAHVKYFQTIVAPRLRLERRRGLQTFALLAQITLVATALAIGLAAQTFAESALWAFVQTVVLVMLELLLIYQFLPHLLLARSRGSWLLPLARPLRLGAYAVAPLLGLYEFSVSLLHLADEDEAAPKLEETVHALEELVEEGEERGILEKGDLPLIASVVQFADKTAREVMTPRPDIVAIQAAASVAKLAELARRKRFSRMPVYGENLDDIKGMVLLRDLLEVADSEAAYRRVSELMRPVFFVPDTKPVVEIARELQRERQEMAVVVDEYGSVAGLITTEDLAEEIIGEISDADQVRRAEIVKEPEGAYLVRGGVELERARQTLGVALDSPGTTTFAGLVHGWFGRVPKPGETLERDGLRVQVLEATPRRVVRLRVTPLAPAEAVAAPASRPRRRRKASTRR